MNMKHLYTEEKNGYVRLLFINIIFIGHNIIIY